METVFASERIDFVRICEAMIPAYLEMVNDVEGVQRYISDKRRAYTAADEAEWVRSKLAEGAVIFSMVERDTGRFIGNIELMDVHDGTGELGIAITAARQNRHFGTEAIRRMLSYAFDELGLETVTLKAFPFNRRGIHVYEACGFTEYAPATERDVFMRVKKAGRNTEKERNGGAPFRSFLRSLTIPDRECPSRR